MPNIPPTHATVSWSQAIENRSKLKTENSKLNIDNSKPD